MAQKEKDVDTKKDHLRQEMTAWRQTLSKQEHAARAARLTKNLFKSELFANASVIAGYWPLPGEMDVRRLLGRLEGMEKELALPRVVKADVPLQFLKWKAGDPLKDGKRGTREPADRKSVVTPDLVLVPGLAFDKSGGRVGYGGGFFDRTLELLRAQGEVIAIGVGFKEQLIDAVPRAKHDALVDYVATDARLIKCDGSLSVEKA